MCNIFWVNVRRDIWRFRNISKHYDDIMKGMAFQITDVTSACSNVFLRRRSKDASKPRVTGLCGGNSPVTGEFPVQRESSAEKVSIWWRHHGNEIGIWRFPLEIWRLISRYRCCRVVYLIQHIEAGTKWPRHFKMHFLEWKCMNFAWDFNEVCS